jgi:hypothetical protein
MLLLCTIDSFHAFIPHSQKITENAENDVKMLSNIYFLMLQNKFLH